MQTQRSFIDDLKHQFKHGGVHIQLIFINVIIYLLISVALVFGELTEHKDSVENAVGHIFGMHTKPIEFVKHPWALFTSIFAHFNFLHLAMNMIFLYFAGKLFLSLFDGKRLLYTYILGGIAGGLLEFVAHLLFPVLKDVTVIGASGSIMAIFVALAFYRPNLEVRLFGLISAKLIWIALAFIILDVINLATKDSTAHFAHIGGAILGVISIRNINSSGNIINIAQQVSAYIGAMFGRKKKSKLTVMRGDKVRRMTDEEYNENAKARQDETDRILDKISKSGYESLNKREKDFLFNQSKNE